MSVLFKRSQKRLARIIQLQAGKRRKLESGVVAAVARGNISLQRGEYLTHEDIDKLQGDLLNFFRSNESEW